MIEVVTNWIETTVDQYKNKTESCLAYKEKFAGFYSEEFLSSCKYVVVDEIPKPDFPILRTLGLGGFLDMDAAGITYGDTYFVKAGSEVLDHLHFHELVHVIQWRILGIEGFVRRYITEMLKHGYLDAPLEKMAYSMEDSYKASEKVFDVEETVQRLI